MIAYPTPDTNKSKLNPQKQGDFAASGDSLGNTTSIASTSPKIHLNNVYKYRMQDAARKLLPNERVAGCMRKHQPGETQIRLMHNPGDHTAHFSGSIVCGSVWSCPICAARVSEERRRELTTALSRTDKHPVLITYTVRHKRSDKLSTLLSDMLLAFRHLKSGRWFKDFASEYGWYGSVRSLEVTHGDSNGWHPHIHELPLFEEKPDVGQLEQALRQRWQDVLKRVGLDCDFSIGVTVRDDGEYIRQYVAKFGREPIAVKSWNIEHEVTKSNVKRARTKDGRTPFQLLFDYAIEGDKRAGALFAEYFNTFKGRNQLVWSKGLKSELGIDDIPDEQLAIESDSQCEEITSFNYFEWAIICEAGMRGAILDVAKDGDKAEVHRFLEKVYYWHDVWKKRKQLEKG